MALESGKIYIILGNRYTCRDGINSNNAGYYHLWRTWNRYNHSTISYYPQYTYITKNHVTARYIKYGTNLLSKIDITWNNNKRIKTVQYGVIITKKNKPLTKQQVVEALTWPYKKPQIDWDCVKEEGCKWSFKQGNIKLRVIDLKDRYRCHLRVGKKNRSFTCPHDQIEQKIKLAKLKLL